MLSIVQPALAFWVTEMRACACEKGQNTKRQFPLPFLDTERIMHRRYEGLDTL